MTETIEKLEVLDTLVIPQGPNKGLCVVDNELHYGKAERIETNNSGVSSVKLEGDRLIIALSSFPSVVKALNYVIEVIDPAIYKVVEIIVSNIYQPELAIKVLSSIYYKHEVFLDINRVIHILQK